MLAATRRHLPDSRDVTAIPSLSFEVSSDWKYLYCLNGSCRAENREDKASEETESEVTKLSFGQRFSDQLVQTMGMG